MTLLKQENTAAFDPQDANNRFQCCTQVGAEHPGLCFSLQKGTFFTWWWWVGMTTKEQGLATQGQGMDIKEREPCYFVNLVPYHLGSLGTFLIPYSRYTLVCFSIAVLYFLSTSSFIWLFQIPGNHLFIYSGILWKGLHLIGQTVPKFVILPLSWIAGEHNHMISNRLIPMNVGRKIHFCSFLSCFCLSWLQTTNTLNFLLAQP